ncbi:hypothetical protein ABIA33_002107 [Streptacidiphilus sp. MAP12-16]|uniref:NPCBM/NEW2 domain-containing protein n=1 Tax=Streptacidiphilus sp. MAP12-16 TaxID=3156300 RepID=UPI003515487E
MDERTGGTGGTGGSDPSDAEAVRRIRAGTEVGGRVAVKAAEKALREFQDRHYAAVFALARVYCGSSQAAANLAAEAFTRALSEAPNDDDAEANWRARVLAAVSGTAESWYLRGRRNELREDFQPWRPHPSRPGDLPAPGAVPAAGTVPGSEETVVLDPTAWAEGGAAGAGSGPAAPMWAEPVAGGPRRLRSLAGLALMVRSLGGRTTRHRRFPSRAVLPAIAVAVLCAAVVAGIPLEGALHKNTTGRATGSSTPRPGRPTPPPSAVALGGGPVASASAASPSAASPVPSASTSPLASGTPTSSAPPSPTATAPATHGIALSDLRWASSVNGEGPVERDESNGGRAAGDGQPLSIRGVVYRKGLGVSAPSDVTYYLGGTCTTLRVDVGIDDEAGRGGSVVFVVYRDDTQVAQSGTLTGNDPAVHLTADLTGGSVLRLVVVDGGGNGLDHADWAAPLLTCG